jgi:D-glycero-D-manno-heptose 1,7-bisphosphate phosphatase
MDLYSFIIKSTEKKLRPALFLDRDGVIIVEEYYLSDPTKVALIDGASGVIKKYQAMGYVVVEITNQSGIGRGLYTWEDFYAVQAEVNIQLAKEGAVLDGIFAASSSDEKNPYRKPNAGMLLEAAKLLNIDLANSIVVGDRMGDMLAGKNAGLKRGYLVQTGYGKEFTEEARGDRFVTIIQSIKNLS